MFCFFFSFVGISAKITWERSKYTRHEGFPPPYRASLGFRPVLSYSLPKLHYSQFTFRTHIMKGAWTRREDRNMSKMFVIRYPCHKSISPISTPLVLRNKGHMLRNEAKQNCSEFNSESYVLEIMRNIWQPHGHFNYHSVALLLCLAPQNKTKLCIKAQFDPKKK